MDKRHALATGLASTQFGAISIEQLRRLNVDTQLRNTWITFGYLEQLGPRSLAIVGSAPSWERAAWAAAADVDGAGFLAGRTGARLQGLDGFSGDEIEVLVGRTNRGTRTPHRVGSTSLEITRADSMTINGIRCLTAERLILDAPLFGFSKEVSTTRSTRRSASS